VFEILKKSKDLKDNKKTMKVFLEPDRTFEERLKHCALVDELKRKQRRSQQTTFSSEMGKFVGSEPKLQVEVLNIPRGPRNQREAQIMRLKAATKPIPPKLYERPSRWTKQNHHLKKQTVINEKFVWLSP
jgi:hypothetical protein